MTIRLSRVIADPARIYYLPVKALKGVFMITAAAYALITYIGRAMVHNFNNIWAIAAVFIIAGIAYRVIGYLSSREPNIANLFFAKAFMRRQRSGLANPNGRLVILSP